MMSKKKPSSYKAGLTKNAFKKNRRWEVDNLDPQHGYVKDLKEQAKSDDPAKAKEAKEALEFLSKFNNEYYDNHGLNKEDALHNTKELRKECYNRTNAANRDIYGIQDSGGALFKTDEADVRNSSTKYNSSEVPDSTMDKIQQPSNPQAVIDAMDDLLDAKLEAERKAKKKKK